MSTLSLRFATRRRTAASWTELNEVLLQSEIGHESDTNRFKFGDGTTPWNSLPYAAETGGGGGGAVDSVNGQTGVVELDAADVGADPAGSASTAQAAAIAAAAADATAKANAAAAASDPAGSAATALAAAIATAAADATAKADAAAAASVPTSALGVSVAELVGGVVPSAQIPALAVTEFLGTVANQAAMLALSGQKGDWAIRSDTGTSWVITGNDPTQLADWTALSYPGAPVTTVNGQTGTVVLGAGDVGADAAGAAAAAQAAAIAASEPTQSAASQAEAEAGTEAAIRKFSPLRIFQAIAAFIGLGTWISGATSKATPVDADTLALSDSAASNALKRVTLANLKATLKTYFDTLYATLSGANTWTAQNTFAAGTITTSQPTTITQTWNAGGVTFTGLLINITDTASAAGSFLQQWQVGGVSKASIDKNGKLALRSGDTTDHSIVSTGVGISIYASNNVQFPRSPGSYGVVVDHASSRLSLFQNYSLQFATGNLSPDAAIGRAGANAIAFGDASNPAAAATNRIQINKAVTAIADATATAVFTVTIPNAAHSASIRVKLVGSIGAGGAVGAREATSTVEYDVVVTRTAGANAVAAISAAFGTAAVAVAGATTVTTTGDLSAISGAVGAVNTFTIRVTITKGGGASANHTCLAFAELLNAAATGITIS